MKERAATGTICLTLLAMSLPAHAHTGAGTVHGYWDGFLHPLLGTDHVLVMVGVGIWGVLLGGTLRWRLPVLFLTLMAAGAGLGFAGISLQSAEAGIAFSAVALALILASERRAPAGMALFLAGLFALSHGYVHASEMAPGLDAIPYALGFLVSTTLLIALGRASALLSASGFRALRMLHALLCAIAGVMVMSGV